MKRYGVSMNTGAPLPTYLTDLQVARWLVLRPAQVRKWAKQGIIPALILPDGSMLFDPSEVAHWIQALPRSGVRGRREDAHA